MEQKIRDAVKLAKELSDDYANAEDRSLQQAVFMAVFNAVLWSADPSDGRAGQAAQASE